MEFLKAVFMAFLSSEALTTIHLITRRTFGLGDRFFIFFTFVLFMAIFAGGIATQMALLSFTEKLWGKLIFNIYPLLPLLIFLLLESKIKSLNTYWFLLIFFFLSLIPVLIPGLVVKRKYLEKAPKKASFLFELLFRFLIITLLLWGIDIYLINLVVILKCEKELCWFFFTLILFFPLLIVILKRWVPKDVIIGLFIVISIFAFAISDLSIKALRKAGIGGALQIRYCLTINKECEERGLIRRGELIYIGDENMKIKGENGKYEIYKKAIVNWKIVDKELTKETEEK